MSIRIYNTLTRKKEALHPIEKAHVKLYVCGITSYDYCHIGHARSALVFDMVVRYLRHRGFKVTYIRNFTDIDDKIINRANEQGVDANSLALRFIDEFHHDMDALGTLQPDLEPKATEHVGEMISLIKDLIDEGMAYPANGDVYFRVERFAEYGRLSGRSLEDMQAGARVEVNEKKEHPMDFVLWKGAKPGEPKWESPWGDGRPGWHIECSAMSRRYLGETFDIHGGGKDLIFPHHENEIAQSCAASGKSFANLWMHHGFVTIKEEKMSKSLGNFLTIRDVLKEYEPEVLRLLIFSTQYRNPLDFSEAAMQDARSGLERMYDCLARVAALPEDGPAGASTVNEKDRNSLESLVTRFHAAMDNDFNTAQALGHLFDAVKTINKILRQLPEQPVTGDLHMLRSAVGSCRELGGILGLLQRDPAAVIAAKKEKSLAGIDLSEEEINEMIARRNQARAAKDWAASDEVRDLLFERGIVLKDSPEGTTWEVRS
ncbi:cysteine--tRNA ligase [Desulfobulbus alkaliphilus]|uniref:cysteine--tRNA ligase n=1 Tax=Desulfobulbus alkaliphilus TaxID=869814 RepID=UPI001963BDB6|nr:cysteine--tRNA ligase [Desulfobulbus alkaliphilus]MBM9537657.1 cysteine--tRNA ligase [Desulfobulbus alkaliphilus]